MMTCGQTPNTMVMGADCLQGPSLSPHLESCDPAYVGVTDGPIATNGGGNHRGSAHERV